MNTVKRLPQTILVLLASALVAAVLTAVAAAGHLVPGDRAIANVAQSVPVGEALEEVADVLARTAIETLVWIVAAFIAWRRKSAALLIAGVFVALALTTNPLLKEIVDRARPTASDLTIRETDAQEGFPSGHVQAATLIYGFAWCALSLMDTRWKLLASCATAAVLLLIGFDRVYNGAHWPSDVAGGFSYGVLLLALAVIAGRAVLRLTPRARTLRRPPDWMSGETIKA
ncbi:MAG: phosphatase PAP2 family protein [Chloroflexota bacterium]